MSLRLPCHASLTPQPQQVGFNPKSRKCLESIRNLIKANGFSSISCSPHESLQSGKWVKLICGASFEDAVEIRNLCLVYTLAGVDCIDCAADDSVVSAVNEGIDAAMEIVKLRRPWVMISVNDAEDLHFRKAEFDPSDCPLDCSRPCENVCPANAISLKEENFTTKFALSIGKGSVLKGGVVTERCYGCGRCFPTSLFKDLWNGLAGSVRYLKLVAISLPDVGDSTVAMMNAMYSIMEPNLHCYNLWQLDGRPMSGDIGRGATREAVAFAVRVAAATDRPPGFLQLAGGTNLQTVYGLKKVGLFQTLAANGNHIMLIGYQSYGHLFLIDNRLPKDEILRLVSLCVGDALIGGVAYGGYARKIVGRVLAAMQSQCGLAHIEDYPDYLIEALLEAVKLVGTVKCQHPLGALGQ
ncbi:Iron-sulfur binding protein LdpA, C-terminal [Dillenia turbinata]|uniref:Iron-sulfur binding protein LdpA, C-terminal n=1 Tax=Dillenia turbinata TaxID=194707 RepID=A0AAN8VHZ2_9MAGN